jgi:hypothetical protein
MIAKMKVSGSMAWYRNYYRCARRDYEWQDEWSCVCDDDCPDCGARHMTAYDADDLTTIIEKDGPEFIVLRSPENAGHCPSYREAGRFATRKKAEALLERLL